MERDVNNLFKGELSLGYEASIYTVIISGFMSGGLYVFFRGLME